MRSTIALNEMRERVAKLIYGADWIGGLTDEQYELLRACSLTPRNIVRADGSTIQLDHVARCPVGLAANLDRAIGRQARMAAQYVTVDSWIQDRGFPVDPRRGADRKQFNRAVRKFQKNGRSDHPVRRRGPKERVLPRVVAAMRDDVAQGRLRRETLGSMLEKELADRYHASRETLRKARAIVQKNN